MRSFRHWTPLYIKDRLALMVYERSHPQHPWLTRAMIAILDSWLQPGDIGLEFGSGRSTRWFAQRVGHLTSVEHNPAWFRIVADQLGSLCEGGDGVDYRLCEDGNTDSATTAYVQVANSIAPESLDFCLIDGVARDHCALASLDKLKPGGILIIDNVNWYIPRTPKSSAPNSRGQEDGYASDIWSEVGRRLESWRRIWTTNGVTDTALWVKPGGG